MILSRVFVFNKLLVGDNLDALSSSEFKFTVLVITSSVSVVLYLYNWVSVSWSLIPWITKIGKSIITFSLRIKKLSLEITKYSCSNVIELLGQFQ